MKILFTAFFLLFFTLTIKSQVIDYFLANEKVNDTLADLRYFKNIDKLIEQKLDSFFSYVKTRKDKKEGGFIEVSMFRKKMNKITADISVNNQYADYRIYSAANKEFGKAFAFTWYKSKLILFTMSYSVKYRVKKEYGSIMHDLIYPEMSKSVRNEIDTKADEFTIDAPGIVRRYYFN